MRDNPTYPLNRCGILVISPPIKQLVRTSYVSGIDSDGRPVFRVTNSYFRR